jgi:hypothetical protein
MPTVEEHYKNLFEVTPPWEVRHVAEYIGNREVRVAIRLADDARVECPRCGRSSPVVPDDAGTGERVKIETKFLHYKMIVDCPAPKGLCETHGEFPVPTPLDSVKNLVAAQAVPAHVLTANGTIDGKSHIISTNEEDAPHKWTRNSRPHLREFSLFGEIYSCTSAMDAVVQILNKLVKTRSLSLEVLSQHSKIQGTKRKYIAKSAAEIYPDRKDFWDRKIELADGWFIGTYLCNGIKKDIVCAAADICGIEFGKDIVAAF